jgi:regulatory protein
VTEALKARALRALSSRDYSRTELARKLAPYGSHQEVEGVLDRMIELGLLSDQRFAASFVRSRAGRYGSARLRYALAERGVDSSVADQALAQDEIPDDYTRAVALWQRRFGVAPDSPKEWARQARFLQSRGFPTDVIRKILKECGDEPA